MTQLNQTLNNVILGGTREQMMMLTYYKTKQNYTMHKIINLPINNQSCNIKDVYIYSNFLYI